MKYFAVQFSKLTKTAKKIFYSYCGVCFFCILSFSFLSLSLSLCLVFMVDLHPPRDLINLVIWVAYFRSFTFVLLRRKEYFLAVTKTSTFLPYILSSIKLAISCRFVCLIQGHLLIKPIAVLFQSIVLIPIFLFCQEILLAPLSMLKWQ